MADFVPSILTRKDILRYQWLLERRTDEVVIIDRLSTTESLRRHWSVVEKSCLSLSVFHHDVRSRCLLQQLLHSFVEDSTLTRVFNRLERSEGQILLLLQVIFRHYIAELGTNLFLF